ncbi:MAG: hypothetical protein LC135_04415 [Phycisphaerae bacterium]|nr:hypothetical protein [Phycisphaerae bacterium]MCZ2399097.1 hypothetical protein [Phycisphaerae bacterium]NUQ49771.1 hypothetical protein [Phycisphaerae bacterium]
MLRSLHPFRLLALGAVAQATAGIGCTEHALVQRRLAERERSAQVAVSVIAKRESESPGNLRKAAQFIADDLRRDADSTTANVGEIEDYLRRDLQRWIDRQDDYLREAGRILRGQPETIERTAVILFL